MRSADMALRLSVVFAVAGFIALVAGIYVTMRMPTLLPFGEGCTSGEAIDTRTRSIRRGSGHGTSERWFG